MINYNPLKVDYNPDILYQYNSKKSIKIKYNGIFRQTNHENYKLLVVILFPV